MARAPSRRADILREAAGLFSERGFAAVSTRDIARAVGISSPSLYKHFASMEDLTACAVEDLAAGRIADYRAILAAGLEPKAQLKTLMVATVSGFQEEPISLHLYQHILAGRAMYLLDRIHDLYEREIYADFLGAIRAVEPKGDAAYRYYLMSAFAIGCAMYSPVQAKIGPLSEAQRSPVALAEHGLASALPGIDWTKVTSLPVSKGRLQP